ncbi:MAG: hypothetical protein Q9226_007347 [Calogaya cf. arnoldii]
MAGINTETTDGVVYSICAGAPYPTIASSTLPPEEAPPKPTPSQAIIIYREDACGDFDCSSTGHIYEITPGQPVNPCKDKYIFGDIYTQSVYNDDSDYPVNFGPFKAHDLDGWRYSGRLKQRSSVLRASWKYQGYEKLISGPYFTPAAPADIGSKED